MSCISQYRPILPSPPLCLLPPLPLAFPPSSPSLPRFAYTFHQEPGVHLPGLSIPPSQAHRHHPSALRLCEQSLFLLPLTLSFPPPLRFAYTFQSLVFISRASQYRHGLQQHPSALRLCERSLFCDRLVFAPAAVVGGLFTPLEEALYDSWVDAVLPMLPAVVPDAFIYLRAEPSVCLQRLQKRSRSEETSVDLPYLQRLHELYDRWFLEGSHRVDPEHTAAPSFSATLDGALTHSALDGVPLLVVNCNQHRQQRSGGDFVGPDSGTGEGEERLEKGAVMGSEVAEVLPGAKVGFGGSDLNTLLDEILPFLQRLCARTHV
ncbi:unnamed protein product [Closterium sp. Naga37s-1]|nr:unnamed protein product [Closterium sp. Naga37s-1]